MVLATIRTWFVILCCRDDTTINILIGMAVLLVAPLMVAELRGQV
jgi:hypothetical protein